MTVWIFETRSQKKAPEDRSSDQPIRTCFQKTRNRIVQSDYSGRTYKSDGPIRSFGWTFIRTRFPTEGSDWSGQKSGRYEDPSKGSDWSVWLVYPTRVIWLDDPISCLLETRLWLDDPMICLLAPYFDFFLLLVTQIHTVICEQQETILWRRLISMTNTPFNLTLRAKQTKRSSNLLLLTLPVVEF